MKRNILQEKSYAFALRIVKLSRYLNDEKKEFVLSKQILRSGTSVGANVEEAIGAISEKDFTAKLSIALKEIRETHYWLRLLRDSDYLSESQSHSLIEEALELIKLCTSIVKTMQEKQL